MRKVAVILISSIFSFIIMTAGYGLWTKQLIIEGNVTLTEDPEVTKALKDSLSSEQKQLESQNQRLSARLSQLKILHEQAILEIQQKQAAEAAKLAEAAKAAEESKATDTDSSNESQETDELENIIPAEGQEDKKEETVVEENITSESITKEEDTSDEATLTEETTAEENNTELYRQESLIEDNIITTNVDNTTNDTTDEILNSPLDQATSTEKDIVDSDNY